MNPENVKPPSEHMERAVQRAGSISITCELCKREHFASGSPGYFEEGELEKLQAKAEKDPDKYVEDHSSDDVPWGHIDGKQAVIGCPCNGLRRYEDFIWHNRDVIARYLVNRAKENLEDAQRDVELAAGVKKATGQA